MLTKADAYSVNTSDKTWYKNPFVWLVIIFPLIAVIGGITTIWIAVSTDDGLVVDDYYKRGMEINRDIERDKATSNYGIKVSFDINQASQLLIIKLQGNEKFLLPENLKVSFINATRKGYDKTLVLAQNTSGDYVSPVPLLVTGKWYVLIEANDWRKEIIYQQH